MVRFDPHNSTALCYGCHSYMDQNPNEKEELFARKIGWEMIGELEAKSKLPYKGIKKDQSIISKRFRELFREINEKRPYRMA